jgi:hypothetical protein
MSIYFTRLRVESPAPLKELEDWPGCWKVYTICANQSKNSSTTRKDVREMEVADAEKARSAYGNLLNRAYTGRPLETLYDEKQCHVVHKFDFNGSLFKIYRLRAGDIRVYFCYPPLGNKNIVLLKTQPKRNDNLSKGEKRELEGIARSVLQYSNLKDFMSRVI